MDGLQDCFPPGIKQEIVENGELLERNLLLPNANNILGETFFHNNYDSSDNSSTKSRTSNESPEARARRLSRNAQRMREKRANESLDEYKVRLAKNAEANRRKRQSENQLEREMRQVKDAARQRLRRAMESPDQRCQRLSKLAERMRMVRANESLDQRSDRLKRSAARARERLSRESSEERRDRLHKRAEYARKMRSINTSGTDNSQIDKSNENTSSSMRSDETSLTPTNLNHNNKYDSQQQSSIHLGNQHQHDFNQSQNLVTLNNVKSESHFQQFALNQNPLFLDLRSGNYLNVPSYPNPSLNVFPDSVPPSQVPPHLQNYVSSLSLPLHQINPSLLSNHGCFPPNDLHNSSHHPPPPPPPPSSASSSSQPSSVIQQTPPPPPIPLQPPSLQNGHTASFLGQHHSPFHIHPPITSTENYHQRTIRAVTPPLPHPLPLSQHHHSQSQHTINHHNHTQSSQNRIGTLIENSNSSSSSCNSLKQNNYRGKRIFSFDEHGNPQLPSSIDIKNDVERQKVMAELLEEHMNAILQSPKRHRGRPSKGRETDNERQERLRKMAESRRHKRANESLDERQLRLQMLTDRARQRREIIKATESDNEKKERLARQAEYARRRRLKEQTPEAKKKMDQRAKELYAKLHIDHKLLTSSTSAFESIKLRIPNPNNRDTKLMNLTEQNNLFEPIIEMQTI